MLDAHDKCSDFSWEEWHDQRLFEALYAVFPKSVDQLPFESIESQFRKMKIRFQLHEGTNSLLPFTMQITKIFANMIGESSISTERSKGLVKILLSLFP